MQRVGSNRNPVLNKFGTGKPGFTAGDPQSGTPATTPGAEWFDAVQEELARVVEGAGMALDSARYDQVLAAIKQIAWGGLIKPTTVNGYGITNAVTGQIQRFTTSGTFVVPQGVYRVCVTLAGGGGGGGGAISGNGYVPGGGGAGEVRYREWVAVTPGQSITVTIGAGGAGGIGSTAGGSYSTSNGGAGGASSFGALLTASGGGGGRCQTSDSAGGVAVGPYAADGQDGDSTTVTAMGAAGGGNLLAPSVYADYSTGGVARGYGSGGGGGRPGTSYWQNGMAGGAGVCIVEW